MKRNCWEIKFCGRCTTMAGDDACPVCKETRLDGIHGGRNAGRACWAVSHTKCGGSTQGTFGKKFGNCMECDFYKMVKSEEQGSFKLSATILSQLQP
jgi:hypothetical protein